jgi:4-amino-4-deoxychorismate lyase
VESALCEGGRDPALKLIETLAWDGVRALRGAGHMARLARSAALLGWSCDRDAAEAALLRGRAGPARLRLTLDRTGRIEVAESPLLQVAAPWRLGLASAPTIAERDQLSPRPCPARHARGQKLISKAHQPTNSRHSSA